MSTTADTQSTFALGIELGSTRVKAILIDDANQTIAAGAHEWRSTQEDGHWTYSMDDVWLSVQGAVLGVRRDYSERFGEELVRVGSLGVSAMMHGYLALDDHGQLLTPFRSWQDTTTGPAAKGLSELFGVNIPLRWSIAHLYQAILDGEEHVERLAHLTTLAGYVHLRLSGELVLGVGDASGMFPIDVRTGDYDAVMMRAFAQTVADRGFAWELPSVLPRVLKAGKQAGRLSAVGAQLLDPSGTFQPGAVMAPPEGDAGTGMVATNSVRPRCANVSAGTSIFAMVVLEQPMAGRHDELDIVTTPAGDPVVMVHCNNGAADLQDWVLLLGEAARALGAEFDTDSLFGTLYTKALAGSADAGGLLSVNYLTGEPITGLVEGRPLFVRQPTSPLSLSNFMRAHLYGAIATLRLGFDLLEEEGVKGDRVLAHGGLFKTPGVAQRFLAAALRLPVAVHDGASEGGAWGMALLARFLLVPDDDLGAWLEGEVFPGFSSDTIHAAPDEIEGFDSFLVDYVTALDVEREAALALRR